MRDRERENIEFGKRLRKLRKEAKLTVEKVASSIEVAASTYREWENGRAISGQPYLKLTKVYGISLYTLFGLSDTRREEISSRLKSLHDLVSEIKSYL